MTDWKKKAWELWENCSNSHDLIDSIASALSEAERIGAAAERERCGQEILQLLRARKEG